MAESQVKIQRPDADILEDIHAMLSEYPPYQADRHHVNISVEDGIAKVSGYVNSGVTHHYIVGSVPHIAGVVELKTDGFFTDDNIRREVGGILPFGVMTRVDYGSVLLYGKLPEDTSMESLVEAVQKVPGVHRIVTTL